MAHGYTRDAVARSSAHAPTTQHASAIGAPRNTACTAAVLSCSHASALVALFSTPEQHGCPPLFPAAGATTNPTLHRRNSSPHTATLLQIPDLHLPSIIPTLFSSHHKSQPSSESVFIDLASPRSVWPLERQILSSDEKVGIFCLPFPKKFAFKSIHDHVCINNPFASRITHTQQPAVDIKIYIPCRCGCFRHLSHPATMK